jgi:hypothetical protein
MLLKDLSPAWPPTSDPSVKPDPQDVIIGMEQRPSGR